MDILLPFNEKNVMKLVGCNKFRIPVTCKDRIEIQIFFLI